MPRLAAALRGLAVTAASLVSVAALPSGAVAQQPHGTPSAGPAAPATGAKDPKAPKEFVALRDVDPTIRQEIRYYTPHNFMGVPVTGYEQPMCILTRDAANALHRAQLSFLKKGYTLKVYDCYRPQRAVNHFVEWAKDLGDQRMKGEFYPRVDKSTLFDDGYIAEKSGHSRGSTVDLTLAKLPALPTVPTCPASRCTRVTARRTNGSPTTRWTWAPASTASTPWRTRSIRASRASSGRTG